MYAGVRKRGGSQQIDMADFKLLCTPQCTSALQWPTPCRSVLLLLLLLLPSIPH
jgi:hypothetical protein